MEIGVLSVTQLYAYLIGWWQYDVIFGIIYDTGLYLIPLVVVFVQSIIIPFLSQETKAGSTTAIKKAIAGYFALVLTFILFVVPSVYINVQNITVDENGAKKTAFDNDTTYAGHVPDEIANQTSISMPVGMYLFLNLANGITAAAFNSLGDDTPIRETQSQTSAIAISDPLLRDEYRRFIKDCYNPAFADYSHSNYDPGIQKNIDQINKGDKYSTNRTNSEILIKYFYPRYQSSASIVGFPFNIDNEDVWSQYPSTEWPKNGRPMCDKWWGQIESQVYDDVNMQYAGKSETGETLLEYVQSKRGFFDSKLTDAEYKSYIVQAYLESGKGSDLVRSFETESNSVNIGAGSMMTKLMTTVGGIGNTLSIPVLINILPIFQLFILAAIFSVLPLAFLASNFNFKFITTSMFFLFSVIFWIYLWHLVSFIDTFLINTFTSGQSGEFKSINSTVSALLVPDSGIDNSEVRLITNYVAGAMFIGFPVVFSTLISAAGYFIGGAVGNMGSMGSMGDSGAGSITKKAGV